MLQVLVVLLAVFAPMAVRSEYGNATLGICSYSDTCNVGGYEGACVSISAGCCSGGVVTSNLCPGSSDIKCCTQPQCTTPSGPGTCMQTSLCSSKGGKSVSGFCSGPDDVQCCVSSGGSCSYTDTCNAGGYEGVCVSISAGCCGGGVVTSNLCPGSSDMKCCTQPQCFTPSGTGTCMQTSACSSKGGNSIAGYCNGPSDLQCCVTGGSSTATYGVDVSTTITSSAASCFKSSGISFVVPRGYMSIGAVDTQVCASLSNAQNAGIATRDAYLFPCPTCSKSALTQMSELVNYLNSNCASAWSGRVWLDIEGTQYWTGNTGSNQEWYKTLKDSCSTLGIRCGVYSSYYQWQGIFGTTSFSYGSELPLWYAHYDDFASFNDFSAFGGWSTPHAKQYQGDVGLCSMNVDRNYASDSF